MHITGALPRPTLRVNACHMSFALLPTENTDLGGSDGGQKNFEKHPLRPMSQCDVVRFCANWALKTVVLDDFGGSNDVVHIQTRTTLPEEHHRNDI